MKFKDIKNSKESDLHLELHKARAKLRDLRFSAANKQLKNVRDLRKIKINIAQLNTVINQHKKGLITKVVKEVKEIVNKK